MSRIAITVTLLLSSLALGTTTSGCGASSGAFRSAQVRHVTATESGGVIALSGPIVPATADAHVVMTEECRGRWRRLEGVEATAMLAGGSAAKAELDEPSDEPGSWRMDDDRLIAYECTSR